MRINSRVTLALALALILSGCTSGLPTQVEGGDSESVTVFDLSLGECVNDAAIPVGSDLKDLPTVNCDEPHDSELYAILGVTGSSYPGEQELDAQGKERCARAFGDFIGIPFAESALEFRFYYPTASSWAQGDRSLYCLAFDPGLMVSGTLLNAKR